MLLKTQFCEYARVMHNGRFLKISMSSNRVYKFTHKMYCFCPHNRVQ